MIAKTIDIDFLRQVTTDSIHVYDALRRAQIFSEEGRCIVTMAGDLLRQAGLAYLLGSPVDAVQTDNSSTMPEEMVSAYMRIHMFYADLKDALYQLAKAHMEAQAWDEARAIMEALLKVDPEYRDVASTLRRNFLDQAKILFKQKKWAEGRAILKQKPGDKEMRLVYLVSFLDENPSIPGVYALQEEEPQVSKLTAYQRVVNLDEKWSDDAYENPLPAYVSPPYEPSKPSLYSPSSGGISISEVEENSRKMEKYKVQMNEYATKKRQYEIYQKEFEIYQKKNAIDQYKFDNTLQALRAELSSII